MVSKGEGDLRRLSALYVSTLRGSVTIASLFLTDHQALEGWHREHVDTPSGPSGRRGRWHETFSRFRLEVVYLPGRDNAVADAMSPLGVPGLPAG